MCVYLFAPGRTLQIDYAAESIRLSRGGRVDVLDLLVTNHSLETVDRVHIIYPQALLASDEEGPPSLADVTNTFLEESSEFNDFYKNEGSRLSVVRKPDHAAVTILIGDPQDVLKDLPYEGEVRGHQELVLYEPADGQVSVEEWTLLSSLGWSIFTLKFGTPIGERKARWIRLKAETGPLGHNRPPLLRRWIRRATNWQIHSFEIAGPLDVRHRIRSALTAAGLAAGLAKLPAAATGRAEMIRQGLFQKLVTGGIDAPGTSTIVRDWRLNIFAGNYRKCEQPQWWGDIEPCGPILNGLR